MDLTEQPLTPAEASIWVDGRGWAPVPRVCPACGRRAVRKGNRHHREVQCVGLFACPHLCTWSATVFGGHR